MASQNKKISITLDGKKIIATLGQTILEVARENGIIIPILCFHPDLDIKASCRICVVEIKGKKGLSTACSTKIEPGMEITTDSLKIKKARKINLELLFSQHKEECSDCVWNFNCQLLKLAKEYDVKINRFEDRKKNFQTYQFGPSVFFDSSKCIDCRNCIEVCEKQKACFLELEEKDNFFQITPSKNPKKDCIYCGQCITHCPVGAFEAVGEFEDVERSLEDKTKKIIFQFAPAIRTSIGEEFDLDPGSIVTGQLVAAIRKLGVNDVFDVSVGADFTTTEEAKELIEKLKEGTTPCLSSCCPAWVKFIEFNYPELIPHVATTRSPHIILGGMIKTYFAQKSNIDPKNITIVSVMPCVAKKYEIEREEVKIGDLKPVDFVLTTRELAYLFKKKKIDLTKLEPEEADSPFGSPSGAGVIYGASGGVMESALRTAYEMFTGKKISNIDFQKPRGMEEIKKGEIKIGNKKVKIAVVNGISNAVKIIEELKKDPKAYDAIEVMACPGGCIGGGGQPLPSDKTTRKARAESLYKIDKEKILRIAHRNPIVEKCYKEILNNEEIIKSICHTRYKQKNKEVKFN